MRQTNFALKVGRKTMEIKEIEGKKEVRSSQSYSFKEKIWESKVVEIVDKPEEGKIYLPWPVDNFDLSSALKNGGIVGIESLFKFCRIDGVAQYFSFSLENPNVYMIPDKKKQTYIFEAARPIEVGEKIICILPPDVLESVVCL